MIFSFLFCVSFPCVESCFVCVCVRAFVRVFAAVCAVVCVVGAVGRSSGGAEEWQQQCASRREA